MTAKCRRRIRFERSWQSGRSSMAGRGERTSRRGPVVPTASTLGGVMRRALVIATAVAATWAGVAAADGVGPGGAHRFITVPANRGTVVETVSVRGGRVLNSRFLRGYFGIPMVAYDGSTDGISHDGRRLVLVSQGARTTILSLDPTTLRT